MGFHNVLSLFQTLLLKEAILRVNYVIFWISYRACIMDHMGIMIPT